MSRRDNAHVRCAACRLHQPLCICALLQHVEVKTRVLVLLHAQEEQKPTNTGRLAARVLSDARVCVITDRDALKPVPDPDKALLLFPSSDARELTAADAGATLVVPDGTWRQARKMRTRVLGLDKLPCVGLPKSDEPTRYRLRAERREGGLSTLEAIARALVVLEGSRVAHDALMKAQKLFVERTLWMRGAITDGQLTGGVPIGARRG